MRAHRLHPKRPIALGLDFGRVIMCPRHEVDGADTRFLHLPELDAMNIAPPEGAFDAIRDLRTRFESRVWIVSKAGPRIQGLTLDWLEHQGFFEHTGMPREHVRFCRERIDKRLHAERLKLTHFIDDRIDVLSHLSDVVEHRYLFGTQRQVPGWAFHVPDWNAVRTALLQP
jgi:hypothetical protein